MGLAIAKAMEAYRRQPPFTWAIPPRWRAGICARTNLELRESLGLESIITAGAMEVLSQVEQIISLVMEI